MVKASSCVLAVLLSGMATLAAAQTADFKPVTDEMLANPSPNDWLMINRTYDEQRFSPLDQINKQNVGGSAARVVAWPAVGHVGNDADRPRRRHVRREPWRRRDRAQRDQWRFHLGILRATIPRT